MKKRKLHVLHVLHGKKTITMLFQWVRKYDIYGKYSGIDSIKEVTMNIRHPEESDHPCIIGVILEKG